MNSTGANDERARIGEIWLFRHGETEWSAVGRHTGRNDLPLSPVGEDQAEELRARIAGTTFDRVICSPLQRAAATCRIAGYLEQAEIDPDTMEWNYGDYEGRTTTEIRVERPGWLIWNDGVNGGETITDVGARADRVLTHIRGDVDAGRRVAVFAHGHFLRILTARWLEQPPVFAAHIGLSPARVSVLGFEHETPVIIRWNT